MKIKCPQCPAEADLGPNGNDLSDTHYKLQCPVITKHLIDAGGSASDIDCPHMRSTRNATILKSRRA